MRLLAISGSLRSESSNTTLIRAAIEVAPDDVHIEIYDELGALPHFNPDLDDAGAPDVVLRFRERLAQVDGVLISTPEYAHGVPGVLKNALDWVVGSGELIDKPIALLNASPRSTYAQASLRETLTVMSAKIVEEAGVTIQMRGRTVDDADRAALRAGLISMSSRA